MKKKPATEEVEHQKHCKAPMGYKCSCVKEKEIVSSLIVKRKHKNI